MDALIRRPVKASRNNRGTISGTTEQIEQWRRKRRQLGLTDPQLLSHILPMLEQIKGVQ